MSGHLSFSGYSARLSTPIVPKTVGRFGAPRFPSAASLTSLLAGSNCSIRAAPNRSLNSSPGTLPPSRLKLLSCSTPSTSKIMDFKQVYETLFQFARVYPFDTDREDYLVHITTGTHVAQICLFLLTESRYLPGKLLQASPERDRTAPGTIKIIDLDLSQYDRIASRRHQETRDAVSYLKGGIDTRNAAFNTLIDRIEQVAIATRDPLLLMGPTGAGKSKLARRIYELKKMRHTVSGEFIDVNCATLRGDGAMSALFGHTKGAFTGALRDRPGVLRAADKGMLFLDEIGELGIDEQAMLLRALEEKTFLPLGSDREVHSDFQLIAGTNRDLLAAVREGRFREDLLARINLWSFTLPRLEGASRRHRAQSAVRARPICRALRPAGHHERRSPPSFPRFCVVAGSEMDRKLSRVERGGSPHGDASPRRTYRCRNRSGRNHAPEKRVGGATPRIHGRWFACGAEPSGTRRDRSFRPRSARARRRSLPARRARFPKPAANFMARRAPAKPARTMPTGCANTSTASGSIGTRSRLNSRAPSSVYS